jgi:hypothetical protein
MVANGSPSPQRCRASARRRGVSFGFRPKRTPSASCPLRVMRFRCELLGLLLNILVQRAYTCTPMADQNPPPLGGEADPNSWHFQRADQEGPLPNPVGHTFPILTHDPLGAWELVGTGFYISGDGLFLTARHNVEHVLRAERQIAPLVIIHPHDASLSGENPRRVTFDELVRSRAIDVTDYVARNSEEPLSGSVVRLDQMPITAAHPKISFVQYY